MIAGVGVDVASVARVSRLYERFGERFLRRAYAPNEILAVKKLPAGAVGPFLASRWAVKEALHKAIGGAARLDFAEIEVVRRGTAGGASAVSSSGNGSNDETMFELTSASEEGSRSSAASAASIARKLAALPLQPSTLLAAAAARPALVFHGRAAEAVKALGAPRLHVSLSHEDAHAVAFVVAELPAPLQ
jgi:phosphopantetheine--protein transferase-like protein